MMRFDYFYKTRLPIDGSWPLDAQYDVFISAYNLSDRIGVVFDKCQAPLKLWLIFPQYQFNESEYPESGEVFYSSQMEESEFLNEFFQKYAESLAGKRLCIDITGFMRPHLLFLIKLLQYYGLLKFDAIYSEPVRYQKKDDTNFSAGPVTLVRSIAGFEGEPNNESSNDILLLGIGYDHELLKQVAEHKDFANIVTLWGFPSLRADMYQESVVRASKAPEAAFPTGRGKQRYYAPVNDPFSTAERIHEVVQAESLKKPITNLYLSPLSTKAQALGFVLYYLYAKNNASSIVFPFANGYEQETSIGTAEIWKYSIELPAWTI